MVLQSHRQRDRSGAASFPDTFLNRVYAIPNPYRTREEFDRFHHADLPSLDDAELGREYRRAQQRLDYESDPAAAAWIAARLSAIRQERARRESARPRGHARAGGQRPPTPAGIRVGETVVAMPRGGRSHGRV